MKEIIFFLILTSCLIVNARPFRQMLQTDSINCVNPQYASNPWCNTQLSASARAQLLLSAMNQTEKDSLLFGVPGNYTGNTLPNLRLGVPPLNMNDGPQGFRANVDGTSTQFPCGLAIAATFSPQVAFLWGATMGQEFVGKGANVQLGPGLNLERVPNDGRNFEYLSGEDPALGYALAFATVQGIQSAGVMANAKHYINNNQETNRTLVSANLDERTRMELYAQPFWGAVDGGVLSVMCSYNRINDTYACENDLTLSTELKGYMGFPGFVMSDWGATHSTVASAQAGLDQQMPDDSYYGQPLLAAVQAGQVSQADFDDHARRVLYAMFAIGLFDAPVPRSPADNPDANVTSPAHDLVARAIAANSTVLLRNAGGLLPLSPASLRTVLVVGRAADARPVTGGGGSGSVVPPYQVTPLQGLQRALQGTGALVTYYDGEDPREAARLAAGADLAVCVLATESGEGSDRPTLDLPAAEVAMTKAVAGASARAVALVIAPGPVLLPFAEEVEAVLLMFMPGQEEGNAFAEVLFGEAEPGGRLPLTIPNVNNEVGFTALQYPGVNNEEYYTEKLEIGYRWYTANNVTPHFPFGFGLSYTTFSLAHLFVKGRTVGVTLANTGQRAGTGVVQLYVQYPQSAGEPPLQLRGFRSENLAVGQSAVVVFKLNDRDLSIWNETTHAFQLVTGTFQIFIGFSSNDLPITSSIQI